MFSFAITNSKIKGEWTLLHKLIWLKATILHGNVSPTSDVVGIGRVGYMVIRT